MQIITAFDIGDKVEFKDYSRKVTTGKIVTIEIVVSDTKKVSTVYGIVTDNGVINNSILPHDIVAI